MSDEFYFLAACSGRRSSTSDAFVDRFRTAYLDWRALETLATRHRITGLFFDALQQRHIEPPHPQRDRLRAAANGAAFSELALVGELKRLLGRLAEAGVSPLVLKGPAISALAYDRLGLRSNRDVDLLVDADERDDALRALSEAGYLLVEDSPRYDAPPSPDHLEHRKDVSLRNSANGMVVELHWRLFDSKVLSGLFHRARSPVLLGETLRFDTLPPDENVIFLCLHGAQHAWSRLKWLVDAHSLMARLGADDLDRIYVEARRRGLHRAMAQAILLSEALFGMDPPPAAAADRGDWRVRALTAIAMRVLTKGGDREIEDMRFGSTLKTLSQYLLVHRRDYLLERMRFDLTHGGGPAADGPLWRLLALRLPVRLFRWLAAQAAPTRPGLDQR